MDSSCRMPVCVPSLTASGLMHEVFGRLFWATIAAACVISTDLAAQEPRSSQAARQVVLCQDCGTVSDVRRIERPIAPERRLLPDIASTPRDGVSGQVIQAVPLFAIGGNGARRVTQEPIYRSTWEVTIRYDNGSFGFVTMDAEPDLLAGDRVRLVEGVIEPLTNNRRPNDDPAETSR